MLIFGIPQDPLKEGQVIHTMAPSASSMVYICALKGLPGPWSMYVPYLEAHGT